MSRRRVTVRYYVVRERVGVQGTPRYTASIAAVSWHVFDELSVTRPGPTAAMERKDAVTMLRRDVRSILNLVTGDVLSFVDVDGK